MTVWFATSVVASLVTGYVFEDGLWKKGLIHAGSVRIKLLPGVKGSACGLPDLPGTLRADKDVQAV